MPWIGAAISAVGGFLMQGEANDQNQQISQQNSAFNAEEARLARQFNAEQADIGRTYNSGEANTSRDWLSQMSNSSYQRAVKDMQAAGLNPMLAYSQGGASTPGGPTASAGAASGPAATSAGNATMLNRFAPAMASAGQAAQIAATQAQARALNAEAAIKESEVPEKAGEDGRPPDSATASLKRQQAQESANRQLNLTADTTRINQIVKNLGEQLKLTTSQISHLTEQIITEKERGHKIILENFLMKFEIPGAQNEAEFEQSTIGRNYRFTEPIINQAGKLLHGAGQARRLFNQGRP